MSIRTRIALAFGVLVFVTAALTGLAVYRASTQGIEREIDKNLLATALQFATPPPRPLQQLQFRQRNVPPGVAVQRVLPDGSTRAAGVNGCVNAGPGADTGSAGAIPVDAEALLIATGASLETNAQSVTVGEQTLRVITVPNLTGNGAVQAARDVTYVETALRGMRLGVLGISLAAGLLAALIGWFLAAFLLRRLRRLTSTAASIAATGRADVRVDAHGSDETAQLAVAFNRMLDSLTGARTAEARLLEDAAHELRTPLTSIRANSAMLSQFDELSPDDRASLVADLQSESAELGHLIEQTLALTGAQVPSRSVPTDLADVARASAARFSRMGSEITVSGHGAVVGDPEMLRRAVGNLLGNALKFAPGTDITLTITQAADRVELSVADRGPGFTPGSEGLVFERFWRDGRFGGMPGSGLGLSIAADVVHRYHGTVSAANRPGGGAVVTLTLPISGSSGMIRP